MNGHEIWHDRSFHSLAFVLDLLYIFLFLPRGNMKPKGGSLTSFVMAERSRALIPSKIAINRNQGQVNYISLKYIGVDPKKPVNFQSLGS